jgi:DNA-binding IclR family transcriptional regulator
MTPSAPNRPVPTHLEQSTAISPAATGARVDEPAPVKATVVLCAAATTDGTRPRDLLELTDLSSGGITMLLDRLEEAGLIRRATGHAPDRRAVTITLTDLGQHDLHHRLERTLPHLAQIRSAVTTPETPPGFAP